MQTPTGSIFIKTIITASQELCVNLIKPNKRND